MSNPLGLAWTLRGATRSETLNCNSGIWTKVCPMLPSLLYTLIPDVFLPLQIYEPDRKRNQQGNGREVGPGGEERRQEGEDI